MKIIKIEQPVFTTRDVISSSNGTSEGCTKRNCECVSLYINELNNEETK